MNEREKFFISFCPHCKTKPVLVKFGESLYVYKDNYGDIWLCPKCRAYVGCHKGTMRPKGMLGSSFHRRLRMTAHMLFDPIWKRGEMSRSDAYRRMAEVLNISFEEAHISQLSIHQLDKLIRSLRLRRSIR